METKVSLKYVVNDCSPLVNKIEQILYILLKIETLSKLYRKNLFFHIYQKISKK